MKVADLLESRRLYWRELETLCEAMAGRSRRRVPAATAARFATLYRAACADLALADAYQFPPGTIQYLHQLVGRAHNQLYRSGAFQIWAWAHEVFVAVPQRLFHDNCLRLAFLVFWGPFVLVALMTYSDPGLAEKVMGKEQAMAMEDSFSNPVAFGDAASGGGAAGFYMFNNPRIGLQCFAFGLLFGIAGLYITIFNAVQLGAAFGYMATVPQAENFYQFVTAHGPFELTAVVLMSAAGMRLGFSLIDTQGYGRVASLRRAATVAMPSAMTGVLMFAVAALIEGFVSPSPLPYQVKAAVAIVSCAMLMFYFVLLGYPRAAR